MPPSDPPPFTAHPAAATPIAVLASDAILLTLVGAAVAERSYAFAAWLGVAAIVPWTPRERLREIGVVIAYIGIGWAIYAALRVPLGARVIELYLPAIAAFIARIRALRAESVRRWIRFPTSVTAAPAEVREALSRAIGTGGGDFHAVDAAVVALAAAPRSAIPEGEADRRAFWIDVFNALMLHAGRGRDATRIFLVMEIFRTRYTVAGVPLTLDEIAHGLLRDGAAPPMLPWTRISRSDPRRPFAVPFDPRIHFALSTGAYSSPPLRVYDGASLDQDLDAAERSFLRAVSRWDPRARVLETSRILSWYGADFGGKQGVRERVARALGVSAEEVRGARLVFSPFDWTSSIS